MKKSSFVLMVCGIFTPPLAAVSDNDCGAVVTLNELSIRGAHSQLLFDVTTRCEASVGHFLYSFLEEGASKRVERNSPQWSAADGKEFSVVDTYNGTIKAGSIQISSIQSREL